MWLLLRMSIVCCRFALIKTDTLESVVSRYCAKNKTLCVPVQFPVNRGNLNANKLITDNPFFIDCLQ